MPVAIAAAILIYGLFTRPFLFPFYLPTSLRVVIEGIPLILLLLSINNKVNSNHIGIFALFIFLSINYLANDATIRTSFLTFVRLAFLLIMLDLVGKNKSVYEILRILLVKFWFIVSILVIVSFVVYWVSESAFSYKPLAINDMGNAYDYYSNFLLGNIRKYYMFGGYAVPKVSWYFTEAGPLSCFFALNFIGAKYLVADVEQCNRFKLVNMLAGLCTLSVTYYIFVAFYFLYKFMDNRSTIIKLLLMAIVFSSTIAWAMDGFGGLSEFFTENTSQANRSERVDVFYDLFATNPEKTILIGNGAELQGTGAEFAMSSGWLTHFSERGLFFTLTLAICTLCLLKRKLPIFYLIVYINSSFEFYLFPIFSIMIVLIIKCEYIVPRSISRGI